MNQVSHLRTIKSYVLRVGRITPRQKRAFELHWPTLGLRVTDGRQNLAEIYQRSAPMILEIGFGMGNSLLQMAQNNPEYNFLGVEVHSPGVGSLLANAVERGLQNIRVYAEDINQVLNECISPDSLDGVLIFFPDPWPKKRHHKRRLIQRDFLQLLWRVLKPHGYVHIATDVTNYAEHVLKVFSDFHGFTNQHGEQQYAPIRPSSRPLTKFEARGTRLGHIIRDMIFIKTDA